MIEEKQGIRQDEQDLQDMIAAQSEGLRVSAGSQLVL